ncbi:MAG: hypothetical protein EOM37_11830 [Proteobacteria bacterium]|nr:hypothetical protein [Pseudomonadota bacterium]
MAVPAWFDFDVYMANKLAQVQAANPAGNWTATSLALAFTNAGFDGEEGAYNHFVQFGAKEDVAPNSLFDAEEYYTAKAIQFNNTTLAELTADQVDEVKQLIQNAGMNAWTHYNNFGSKEGVNPSNTFDESAYLTAKLTALQAADPTNWAGKTEADVSAAFKAAGFSALTHFLIFNGKSAAEVADGASFPVPADEQVTVITPSVPGSNFTLTNSATPDTIIGTAGNDTVNGPSGTVANADLIIDQSTTDSDTANLVVTSPYAPSNITNIENVNLDWDAFGTATYNLTNVKGAETVTLTSAKVGYLGNATVTNANAMNLVAGAGTVGTLNASGFKTGTVDAGSAKTVVVDGSTTNSNNESIAVTVGDAATSVSVGATNGFKAATVNAGKATAVTIKDAGNTTDTTDLTVNANAAITNTGSLGALTLTASDTNKISLTAIGASLAVKGTGAVEITANGALTGETVTNGMDAGSTLTLKDNTTAAANYEKVQATTIELTGVKAGADTVANGANLKYSGGGAINVTVAGTGTADAVTAELTTAAVTRVTSTGVETLTVKANATQVSGADVTIATVDTGGANTIKLTGANDVTVTTLNGAAGKLDATALEGDLIVSGTGTVSTSVSGGTGKLNFTYSGTTQDGVAIGQSADDTVTAIGVTTGSMTAILGDGKNNVSATGLTTGTLVVTAGSGIDTVTAGAALTTGVINLNLGDGANVINLDDAAGAGTREVTTGGGDDTLNFTGDLDNANDVMTWTAGAGTDTLVLVTEGADISGSKVTLSGVEVIKVQADGAGNDIATATATLAASNLSGSTLTIKAASYDADNSIAIKGAATTTAIDLSGVTIDQSITAGIARVYVDGSANLTTSQTITGTAVADWITGGDKADTITGGKGQDVITGSKGNDSIDLTESTADQVKDVVQFLAADNGKDTITGFKAGTDDLALANAATTVGGVVPAAVHDTISVALLLTAGKFDISVGGAGGKTTATADVLELTTTLSSHGDLDLAVNGTELFKALGSTATTAATAITAAAAGNKFYLVAYQDGNAYLYQADASAVSADADVTADEIQLVGVLNGITAGTLDAGDFITY